jgi:hypothetical protein
MRPNITKNTLKTICLNTMILPLGGEAMRKPDSVIILFILAVSLGGCLPGFSLLAQAGWPEKTIVASTAVAVAATSGISADPSPTQILPVTMHTRLVQEELANGDFLIQVSYPQLTWGNDTRVEPFNQAIEALIAQEINQFRQAAGQTSSPEIEDTGGFLQIRYDLVGSSYGILSFEFIVDAYIAPAAHPGRRTFTVNYDMVAGNMLALDDLFAPGSPYLNTISQICIEDLTAKEAITWDTGAQPLVENYQVWSITDAGLRITFDEYQVTSYSEGPQTVTIPYWKLKELVPPEGRLAGFVN